MESAKTPDADAATEEDEGKNSISDVANFLVVVVAVSFCFV